MNLVLVARRWLGLLAWMPLTAFALAPTPVFINELHYDNGGDDANETIEIGGPVGTDLSAWSVLLYNGSNGTVYDALALSGSVPANCPGMAGGVVVVIPTQIQNGGPDGIALMNGTTVVQFLSYEGSFTATDGPASGAASTDIGVAESGATTSTESLQLTGSGTQDTDFTWNAPAAASFGACNAGQTIGSSVDVPPTVASTDPLANATAVAVDTNIAIHFSEAVSAGTGWATLACVNSGSHSLSITGSGADYVLNPDVDAGFNEQCSVTVIAAQIADLDGNADAMASDYVFSFDTAADTAPTVESTDPANAAGAVAVAANISVTFSEPVSVSGSWYSLLCANSGSHIAVQSGGPSVFTLDPDVDFESLEVCTFTIVGSAVQDLDGSLDAMAADVVVQFTIAGDGSDYYAGVDTSSGPALKVWLHNRIDNHTVYPYTAGTTDTWDILNQADQDPANSANILDHYKNESLVKISGGQGPYNREHTWPNSLGFPNSSVGGQPNPPYTDIHMLHLTNTDYNADRGNKPYGDCDSGCTELVTVANGGVGGTGGGDSNWVEGADGNAGTFEVWDYRKGDMARAVMYMAVRYEGGIDDAGIVEPDLELTDNRSLIVLTDAQSGSGGDAYMGLLSDLLAWHAADPPGTGEQLRNELVFSYQGNRNPFIDHPEWARCVFLNLDCPAANDLIFSNGFETTTP